MYIIIKIIYRVLFTILKDTLLETQLYNYKSMLPFPEEPDRATSFVFCSSLCQLICLHLHLFISSVSTLHINVFVPINIFS